MAIRIVQLVSVSDDSNNKTSWFAKWNNGTDTSKLRITKEEADEILLYNNYREQDPDRDQYGTIRRYDFIDAPVTRTNQ